MLVFSAHAADFVWRAGGAIALYASRGCRVRILCLSYGERGESQGAWKELDGLMERLVQEYRTCRPDLVLTHSYADPYNPDHPAANAISLQARVYAQAEGYPLPLPALGAPPVVMFEPHRTPRPFNGSFRK